MPSYGIDAAAKNALRVIRTLTMAQKRPPMKCGEHRRLPITSAERFSPFGPLGIGLSQVRKLTRDPSPIIFMQALTFQKSAEQALGLSRVRVTFV